MVDTNLSHYVMFYNSACYAAYYVCVWFREAGLIFHHKHKLHDHEYVMKLYYQYLRGLLCWLLLSSSLASSWAYPIGAYLICSQLPTVMGNLALGANVHALEGKELV